MPERAGKDEIAAEQVKLVAKLVEALGAFKPVEAAPTSSAFKETQPKIGKGFFFGDGEVLGRSKHDKAEFVMLFRSVLYLRLIPVKPLARPLPLDLLLESAGRYGAFGSNVGVYARENDYGVITFSAPARRSADSCASNVCPSVETRAYP